MNKRKLLTAIAGFALISGLQGCSSGGLSDGEIQGDEVPPSADASTDPVPPDGQADLDQVAQAAPQDGMEAPPPDPNAAPPDPNAPPDAAPPPTEAPPAETTPPPAVAETPPAETTPPAQPAETKEVAHSGDETEYRVAAGDTLMKIAFEHYGDLYKWKEVFELNRDKITNPNSIPKGTVLKLNPSGQVTVSHNGDKYLIKHGDTLGTISNDLYGTSSKWKKLWKNNRELIKDPNRIFAGFYLYYTITDEERQHAPAVKDQPVAKDDGGGEPSDRNPASAPAAGNTAPAPVPAGGNAAAAPGGAPPAPGGGTGAPPMPGAPTS